MALIFKLGAEAIDEGVVFHFSIKDKITQTESTLEIGADGNPVAGGVGVPISDELIANGYFQMEVSIKLFDGGEHRVKGFIGETHGLRMNGVWHEMIDPGLLEQKPVAKDIEAGQEEEGGGDLARCFHCSNESGLG